MLYNIYTPDIPKTEGTELMVYADDTGIMAISKHPNRVTNKQQSAMYRLKEWFIKWKVAVNEEKSTALMTKGRKRNSKHIQRKSGKKLQRWK